MSVYQRRGSLVPQVNPKDFVVDYAGAVKSFLDTSRAMKQDRLNEQKVKAQILRDKREADLAEDRNTRAAEVHKIDMENKNLALAKTKQIRDAGLWESSAEGVNWKTSLDNGGIEGLNDAINDLDDPNPEITAIKQGWINEAKKHKVWDSESGTLVEQDVLYGRKYRNELSPVEVLAKKRDFARQRKLSQLSAEYGEERAKAFLAAEDRRKQENMDNYLDADALEQELLNEEKFLAEESAKEGQLVESIGGQPVMKFGNFADLDAERGQAAMFNTVINNVHKTSLTDEDKHIATLTAQTMKNYTDGLSRVANILTPKEFEGWMGNLRTRIGEIRGTSVLDSEIPQRLQQYKFDMAVADDIKDERQKIRMKKRITTEHMNWIKSKMLNPETVKSIKRQNKILQEMGISSITTRERYREGLSKEAFDKRNKVLADINKGSVSIDSSGRFIDETNAGQSSDTTPLGTSGARVPGT